LSRTGSVCLAIANVIGALAAIAIVVAAARSTATVDFAVYYATGAELIAARETATELRV